MKVRALAWITFRSMLRNKFIMLFCAVFLCVILLMMTPLMAMKSAAASQAQGAMMVLGLVSAIMSMLTGFGSLLAAWSAADAVAAEMKSGTILAVMARPVRRWEFLRQVPWRADPDADLCAGDVRHELRTGLDRGCANPDHALGADCVPDGALFHLQCYGDPARHADAPGVCIWHRACHQRGGQHGRAGFAPGQHPAIGPEGALCDPAFDGSAVGEQLPVDHGD